MSEGRHGPTKKQSRPPGEEELIRLAMKQSQPSEELARQARERITGQLEENPDLPSPENAEAETAPLIKPPSPAVSKAVTGKDPFSNSFERGFASGLAEGKELSYEAAFADGVRHFVTLAENFLVKELKLPSREALVNSGKIPAWWMLALVTNFVDGRGKKGDEHHD